MEWFEFESEGSGLKEERVGARGDPDGGEAWGDEGGAMMLVGEWETRTLLVRGRMRVD